MLVKPFGQGSLLRLPRRLPLTGSLFERPQFESALFPWRESSGSRSSGPKTPPSLPRISRSGVAALAGSHSALHLERIIALANMHYQILSVLHPQIDWMEQSVRLQRFGPVGDVVLVAQLVGDVFERLLQIFHLEGEECLATGLRRQVLQHLIAVAFDLANVGGDGVDHDIGLLRHFERLVARVLALVVVTIADNYDRAPELVLGHARSALGWTPGAPLRAGAGRLVGNSP